MLIHSQPPEMAGIRYWAQGVLFLSYGNERRFRFVIVIGCTDGVWWTPVADDWTPGVDDARPIDKVEPWIQDGLFGLG